MKIDSCTNEYAVLGALLVDSSRFPEAAEILTVEDFGYTATRVVFEAMTRQHAAKGRFDAVTIRNEAARACHEINTEFVHELLEITPTAENLPEYVRLVKQDSLRRSLNQLGMELTDTTADPLELLGRAQECMDSLTQSAASGEIEDVEESMHTLFDYLEGQSTGRAMCVPTGLQGFDDLLGGGLINGGFHILAARPSVGKTSLALQITLNAVQRGVRVLYVSLEMASKDCLAKLVGNVGGISPTRLMMGGKLSDDEYKRLAGASARVNALPIKFNRRTSVRVQQLESMTRRTKAELLVVDYLGLLEPPERRLSLYEATTKNSRALKQLAMKLNIPILCLCQLNRAAATGQDGCFRATMANLRESGAIEQDADTVTLLHNPPTDGGSGPEARSCLELYLDKNRWGQTGKADAAFYKHSGRVFCERSWR